MRKTEGMKKLLSGLLALTMVVGYIPAPAHAEEVTHVEGCSYVAPSEGTACAHPDACPVTAKEAVPCVEGCTFAETGAHIDGCTWQDAVAAIACDHTCETCGYVAADPGKPCDKGCANVSATPAAVYAVTIVTPVNGTVTADPTSAEAGKTVKLTVTPNEGYELETLTVKAGETAVEVKDNAFTMPAAAVNVTVTFKAKVQAASADPVCSNLEGCTEDTHVEGCALYVKPADPVCSNLEGCTDDTHAEGCALYVKPADPVCSNLEGCTEDAHVEGCALYVKPADPVCSNLEGCTEDTHAEGCALYVAPTCTCETFCNGTNFDCPVCAEDFGLCAHVKCTCAEKCTEETVNYWCPVCGAEGADLTACTGTETVAAYADITLPANPTLSLQINGAWVVGNDGQPGDRAQSGTGWSFDAATSTLTLTKATLGDSSGSTNPISWGGGNLTIVLEGANTINADSSGFSIYFNSSTSSSTLTITGTGTLTCSGKINSDSSDMAFRIENTTVTATTVYTNGSLTISDSIVTTDDNLWAGLYAGGTMTIENSTVTAKSTDGYGIQSVGNLTITGSTVTASGSYDGITSSGDISISGSRVEAAGTRNDIKGYASSTCTNSIILTDTGADVYGAVTLTAPLTINEGQTLNIPTDASLTIAEGVTLTIAEGGTKNVQGTLTCQKHTWSNGTCTVCGKTCTEVGHEWNTTTGTTKCCNKKCTDEGIGGHKVENNICTQCKAYGYCGAETNTGGAESVTWALDTSGKLTISGTDAMADYKINSPAPWKGLTITSAEIGTGVTTIGSYAFDECTGLKSVTIPSGITTIDRYAFRGCTSLSSVTIPGSVTTIGSAAFNGCTGLTSLTISNGVTKINAEAFNGCTSLTTVTIPGSVTQISLDAFYGCTSLTTVTISEGVESINNGVFQGCTSLTEVTIPGSVKEIQYKAFADCTALATVNYLGTTAPTVHSEVFNNSTQVQIVNVPCTYPDNVTTFGETNASISRTIHNWQNGVCQYGCQQTHTHETSDWEDKNGICKTCGWEHTPHEWENSTCKTCGVTHTHVWSYQDSGDDDKITAICNGTGGTCTVDGGTVTITLSAPTTLTDKLTYSGDAYGADVSVSSNEFTLPEGTKVVYTKGGTQLTDGEKPTDAGEYTATLTLGEDTDAKTAKVEYTIEKADPTIAWADSDLTQTENYNGQKPAITAPEITLVNGETFDGEIQYSYAGMDGGENQVSGSGLPTNAGTYTITASIAEQDNYNTATSTNDLMLTISKIDPTCTAPTGLTATYGQTLADVTLTNPAGNTAGTWTWADSTASVGNASETGYTFKATFTPEDQVNYNTVTDIEVTVTVGKADSSVDTAPAAKTNLSYTGSDQALVTAGKADGGKLVYALSVNGEYTETIPTGKNAGDYTVWYKVVGDENHNDTAVASVFVTIAKADPNIGEVTCTGTLYDSMETSAVVLTCANTTVPGTLVLTDAKLDAGTNTYNWKFTPKDTDNYNEKTGTINLTVEVDTLQSIAARGTLENPEHTYGDALNLDGVTVTATYASGATKVVTDLVTYDKLIAKQTSVTLTYEGKTCTVEGIVVHKAKIDLSGMGWTVPQLAVFTGNPYSANLSGNLPEGVVETTSGNVATDVGTYTATATFSLEEAYQANYELVGTNPLTSEWSITEAAAPKVSVDPQTFVRTQVANGSVELGALLPEKRGETVYTVTSSVYTALENVSVDSNGKLTFKTKEMGTATTNTITVKVEMLNYADCTINVTVELVDKTTVTITGVSAATDLTYDGNSKQGYTGTPTSDLYTGSYDISYTGRNGTSYDSTTPPTNAGDYTVTIKVPDTDPTYTGSTTVDFSIGKGTPTCTPPKGLTATYGDKRSDVTLTNPEGNTPGTWAWENPTEVVGNFGDQTYKATFTPTDRDNYKTVEGVRVTITVGRANSKVDTAPTAKTDLVYDSTAQELVEAGTATGGEMQYSLDNATWGTAIPTGTNAGDYTVYYKVVGDSNHNDTTPASVTVTIGKAEGNLTTDGSIAIIKTYGDAAFTLPELNKNGSDGALTYSTDSIAATVDGSGNVTILGAGNATITVTMAEDANHNEGTLLFLIDIAKAQLDTPDPINKRYLFDEQSSGEIDLAALLPPDRGTTKYDVTDQGNAAILSESAKVTTGGKLTYSVNNLTDYGSDASTAIKVTATMANYKDVELTVNISLTDKYPVEEMAGAEVAIVGSNVLTYGQTLDALTLNTTTAKFVADIDGQTIEVPGTLSWENPKAVPNVATTSATWKFIPDDPSTYEELTGAVTIVVNKADSSVSTVPTGAADLTYDGEGHGLITNIGTTQDGEIQFSLEQNGSYSADIPTGTDAKTYTVWYKVEGDDNHNDSTPASVNVTIAPKPITVTATAEDRQYDGTTTVTVSGALNDVESNDSVSVEDVTGTIADPNVGDDKAVTGIQFQLKGEDADNYSLTQPTDVTVNITERHIHVQNMHMDGVGNIDGVVFTGLVDGETLTMGTDFTVTVTIDNSTTPPTAVGTVHLLETDTAKNYKLYTGTGSNETASEDVTGIPVYGEIVVQEPVVTGGAPATTTDIPAEVRDSLAANNETAKQAVESGKDVNVWIEVEGLAETQVPADDKAKIEDLPAVELATGIRYMDISMLMQVEGESTTHTIKDAGSNVTITLTIPSEIRTAPSGYTRTFSIVVYHEGDASAEVINGSYNAATYGLSFVTRRFSTYALVYTDVLTTPTYNVAVSTTPSGYGTVSGGGSYLSGSSATVNATANTGYQFVKWTENGVQVSTSASYTFQVSGNRNLIAVFEQTSSGGTVEPTTTYTVTVSASPADKGAVTGSGTYNKGSSVTVKATALEGYHFVSWNDGGNPVSTNASYTFSITSNRTLVAVFEKDPHVHAYDEWEYNSSKHWQVCECGEETKKESHDFGAWKVVKEATSSSKGEKQRTCKDCGYVQSKTTYYSIIPNTGDTFNMALWIGIMGLSAVAVIGLLAWNKKRKNK